MFKATFSLSLLCASTLAYSANVSICDKIAEEAEASGIGYYPSAEAKVIGVGKVSFYNAPSTECKMKGVFVIKGNYLTVYKSYKGWVMAMYVSKNGEDFTGWLPESKVKVVGQYGQYPLK